MLNLAKREHQSQGWPDAGNRYLQPCSGRGGVLLARNATGIAMMLVDTRKGGFQVAQKITTLFIDDIDGGAAEGTVRFALDGTEYEIDLNAEHSEELRSALGKYVSHARKVGGSSRRAGRAAGRAGRGSGSTVNTTEIRNWARENGYDIKDRGRVPADLVAKYQAATGK